ncbi:MAG: hypothetical protein JWN34_1965 [Bryobacterales bacterium]|nr:hypothetical protein [Bryobacterales bacterium]
MTPKLLSPDLLALVTRIIAEEASLRQAEDSTTVFRVAEKLRHPITRLIGTAGFHSLLSRSLTLTKTIRPEFQSAQAQVDGALRALQGLGDHENGAVMGMVLISQFLALLAEFIGEALVTQVLLDIWPDFSAQLPPSQEQQQK